MANLREKHFKTAVITVFNDIQQTCLRSMNKYEISTEE